jgi:hypothetical protein
MWTSRAVRRIGLTLNPLCRISDRIEAWLTLLLLVLLPVLVPWAGWWTAQATYRHDLRINAWERQHRFSTTAVLLQDAARSNSVTEDGMPPPMYTPARWSGPDGALHVGSVVAHHPGEHAGSAVAIWVDDRGAMADRPGRRSPTLDALITALFAMGSLAATLTGLRRIAVWQLDRHRLRSWQAEWLVVAAPWSRR